MTRWWLEAGEGPYETSIKPPDAQRDAGDFPLNVAPDRLAGVYVDK
jgi:hypothetical protein